MMIGEKDHANLAVQIPPWYTSADHTANIHFSDTANYGDDFALSPLQNDAALTKALQRYLPSNRNDVVGKDSAAADDDETWFQSCDEFRMYEFKVRKCGRGRSHDWTDCPFAHPGEKARRRDPRAYAYSGSACPDFRKGGCRKGDACEFAHGVFECWLHPARYRTQPCKDGLSCKRRVCFFAHVPEELRVLSPGCDSSHDGSPHRSCARAMQFVSSPESESPPVSPMTTASSSVNEMVASLRQLQLNKVKSMPSSRGVVMSQVGSSPGHGSPGRVTTRPGFFSLPSTPTESVTRPGLWDEIPMERVESGRDLRARMFQKLSVENPLNGSGPGLGPDPNPYYAPNPDVGWVSDIIN